MRILIILLLLVLLNNWARKEASSSPYLFSSRVKEVFAKDTTLQRVDMAAYAFSYIGEYKQALSYFDKGNTPKWNFAAKDSLYLLNFKPYNAKEYILKRAQNEQIIIINESHHNPLHRVFTASLLKDLYEQGFRYFGAETLSHYDSTLNERKYPVLESGFYTKEPQYGNLIREALQLGFTVFPYDAAISNPKVREIAQARRIQRLLRQDPNARILIHCGYAHVYEAPLGGSWEKAMAGRVKEFTGIDPFTIDQERWTEKSEKAKENPAYRLLQVTQPSVLINQKGEAFRAFPNTPALIDIRVAHPRTTYRYGRPIWLLREKKCKPYFVRKEQLAIGFPCLVLAYKGGEPADGLAFSPSAVPVDVIELKKAGEQKALILPSGMYQLVVKNEQGQKHTFMIFH